MGSVMCLSTGLLFYCVNRPAAWMAHEMLTRPNDPPAVPQPYDDKKHPRVPAHDGQRDTTWEPLTDEEMKMGPGLP